MARTIRLQSDSNAHDRPWRVAVEQGFFAEEGLDVVYQEDNPKGNEGRVKDFSQRWNETQHQQGMREVHPVCEWGAIERVQQLGRGKIIGLDATIRTGAIMVRKDSRVETLPICATRRSRSRGMRAHSMPPSKPWRRLGYPSTRSNSNTRLIDWLLCSAAAPRRRRSWNR